MEFYGFFLGVGTNGYFIKLKPYIESDVSDNPVLDSDGLYDMSKTFATEGIAAKSTVVDIALPQTSHAPTSPTGTDNTDNYRFLQTQGFLTQHRPCYMVTEAKPTQINRVTTQQTEFVAETPSL